MANSMEVRFKINGKPHRATPPKIPLTTSLNTFLREHAQLRGTKFMCLEGGCGACIVTATGMNPTTHQQDTWAINSCLASVYSCHNLDITTVEGLGNRKDGYHPIQKRLAHLNGTQCGYCSPGMVMNMYGLLNSKNRKPSMEEVENSFGGNICRCTGYRPILDAFKGLAVNATDELKNLYVDDIEDVKVCTKTGVICSKTCSDKQNLHIITNNDQEWHKVYKLADNFNIFNNIGNKPYMLVAGNTAHGVYRRSPNIQVFIDVTDVSELHSYTIDNKLEIAGNVSLSETMKILAEAANADESYEYVRQLIKHIDLVANVPVRNIGTIAGNLSIKHQYNEFPSDIYLLLEAIGAKITIAQGVGNSSNYSPIDYLQVDMNKKVITKITFPNLDPSQYVFRSYKITSRAQNTHADVNAAFLFQFNKNKNQVISERICFGGINPNFTHAYQAEAFLIGKKLYNDNILQSAIEKLNQEIVPDSVLPDPSAIYRKKLAISLFYKFVLNTSPPHLVKPEYRSGGELLKRGLSSGKQEFETVKKNWPITEPVTKLEAIIQCSGEAEYTNDLPHQPGELWAAFVIATEVNSKIECFDASEAMQVSGVVAFYSAKDIPGKNNFYPSKLFGYVEEEEIFCSELVLFHGQPAGIIVAETFEIAHHAEPLVKIIYERTKLFNTPILPNVNEVLRNNANEKIIQSEESSNDFSIIQMNNVWSQLFSVDSKHSVKGHFEVGAQFHFSMENQSCICVPRDDGMDIHSATQWIDIIQIAVSECLKVPQNKLNLTVRRLGGGFGAKISRSSQIACATALACFKLNRPVRFVMTIEENMTSIGKRGACINDYQIDVDDEGKIQTLYNTYYEDAGCHLNEDQTAYVIPATKNCYDDTNWNVKPNLVKTNAPSNTWCRAPGGCEAIAMIENMMEHIARVVKKSPESVRLANIPSPHKMRKVYLDFLKSIYYEKRKTEINSFNKNNIWRKKGIATTLMEFPIIYGGLFSAFVAIYHKDGTVAITHGGIEIGQGIHTKVAQVAAYVLGIPLNMISVKPTESVTSANCDITGSSVTSESVVFAVVKACEELNQRIQPIRNEFKTASWVELLQKCYERQIDLTAKQTFKTVDVEPYNILGCACAEIELDVLTGNILISRVDIYEETGESMSPYIDVGQAEGAFIMGLGIWLSEDLIYNRMSGELLTTRTWNYKPPGAKDIPIDFRIKFIQTKDNGVGVLRSKTLGEPPLCMAVVVLFAVRHALDSVRKDVTKSVDWYPIGIPVSPEQVLLATEISILDYKL